ncbi:glycoside hydrolase domain-containing protein [Flavihumibacter sp. UBA7668]|uniref:glycoside hydrolase domain-containing protein n=1 Tax=Flavihumibacter sp. UBA7668 TaxID=1946542 RepID=UPI0025B7AD74|nr:glycoside hydrolase domain-containing protein [Flavihumibacter sp. UBA7668]
MTRIYFAYCILLLFVPVAGFTQVEKYGIAEQPWEEALGNHRAVLKVKDSAEIVRTIIHWRRRDADPRLKRMILLDASGRQIRNIVPITMDREKAEILFQPQSGEGIYYLYYMPFIGKKNVGWWEGAYLKPESSATEEWLATISGKNKHDGTNELPIAAVEKLESRTAFDSFYPMEVCATKEEREKLVTAHAGSMLLFPEDRRFPIRMTTDLPVRWIPNGPSRHFHGTASRNEYYVFQIGVFAADTLLTNVKVKSNLPGFTCFNTGGVDASGRDFTKQVNIPKGSVQAMWIGIDISEKATMTPLNFKVFVESDQAAPQSIDVRIDIDGVVLADRGDSEPWRHSRLRWLNSRLGINDDIVEPYTPLQVKGKLIRAKTAQVVLNDAGFPEQLIAGKTKINAAPIQFEIQSKVGLEVLEAGKRQFVKKTKGTISWKQDASNERFQLTLNGTMEFDGTLQYDIQVKSKQDLEIEDIRLLVPVDTSVSRYFMGMGLPGGACPQIHDWKWKGAQDAFWIGDVDAGLHVELQGATYNGPLLNLYKPAPPPSWFNENKGGFRLQTKNGRVLNTIYSGQRLMKAGEELPFKFKLLVTPVKNLNTKDQFVNRYYHNGNIPAPKLSDLENGIKITNVHHANPINPYINYPFIAVDSMRNFVNYWHAKGLKVKIYYTIRELTNQLPELWALRSLGSEIFGDGNGGGFPWLQEHLMSNYNVQWFNKINGYEECDASILTSGESRWYNYYIEGLRWLVQNLDIDGLYLDDVSFDRTMLKRMRKVMDQVKPGCLIDLHSNTGFSKGPATQYTEYFPYINKLWFGESFQYDKMPPENWMVEVSGIPFGLMGDMLHGGGNPWKGPLYGMTVRYPWGTEGVTCDPRDIWKVWDNFGIQDARMIGYWDPANPVRTNNKQLLATAYQRKNKLLVSVGSWAENDLPMELTIDWRKIGRIPASVSIIQPDIPKFQEAKKFKPEEPINIPAGKGVLLEINY